VFVYIVCMSVMNSVVRWWNVVYVKMWLLRYMQQVTGRDDETCPCVSMFRRPVATSNYVSIAVCCTSTTRRHIRWDAVCLSVCLSVCTCVCVCQSVNLWPHCFFVHKYESQSQLAACCIPIHLSLRLILSFSNNDGLCLTACRIVPCRTQRPYRTVL